MKRIFVLIGVTLLVSCSQKAKTNQEVDASVTEQTTENIKPLPKDAVYIPDAIFKNYLLNNEAINTNGDDEIQITEAQSFTGEILVFRMGITDLTGIEAFTSLTLLDCLGNQLTSLNVSNNTALTSLYCNTNKLTALDVSENTALTELLCDVNQLTTLDVSNNTELSLLSCRNNQIKELDISKNVALTWFYCNNNKLIKLNLKNNSNTQIERMRIDNNPNLRCIKVDNPTFSAENWKGELFWLDDGLIFSKDCK